MGTAKSTQDHQGSHELLRGDKDRMEPSPLKDAFELIHVLMLHHEEEGIGANATKMSIREEVQINPDHAIAEAVRMGLVEEYTDPDFLRKMLRRGPRSGEMLRKVYGRNPPTLESLLAVDQAWERFEEARYAKLDARREAGRPKEHNTVASLPAWVP